MWHYLAGSAAFSLSQSDLDAQATTARKQFSAARGAAPSVSWLNALSRDVAANENETDANFSNETVKQVEALERLFASMGQVHNRKFEAKAASILKKLQDASTFETAQVELGEFLGFTCGHEESDAAPDPWWLGDNMALIFETHADGKEATIFGAVKARQAAGHPKWIHANVKGAESMTITPVLVTPCTKVHSGAHPHLSDVMYWNLSVFVAWASEVVSVLRRLKGKFPGEGDLVWRAEAAQTLADNYMTLETILSSLETAASAMHVDQ